MYRRSRGKSPVGAVSSRCPEQGRAPPRGCPPRLHSPRSVAPKGAQRGQGKGEVPLGWDARALAAPGTAVRHLPSPTTGHGLRGSWFVNLGVRVGVPPCGGKDRLKPGLQPFAPRRPDREARPGAWTSPIRAGGGALLLEHFLPLSSALALAACLRHWCGGWRAGATRPGTAAGWPSGKVASQRAAAQPLRAVGRLAKVEAALAKWPTRLPGPGAATADPARGRRARWSGEQVGTFSADFHDGE
jgi:hypothetical protein